MVIGTGGIRRGDAAIAKEVALVALGIGALVLASKIRVPMWPVPMTMQTLAVLGIGALYGLRQSLLVIAGYGLLGAAGLAVFAGDHAGLAYLAGPTGGYLAGFAVAMALVGGLMRRGWGGSAAGRVAALALGLMAIYAAGLGWMAWLFAAEKGMAWVLQYGMVQFLPGDALKLALAAMVLPLLRKTVGR
jgi:biotin transport system substrate-specific component